MAQDLNLHDDLLCVVQETMAAGRARDASLYLQLLHQRLVHTASLVDRADDRSLLEGLKQGTNKRRRGQSIPESSPGFSAPGAVLLPMPLLPSSAPSSNTGKPVVRINTALNVLQPLESSLAHKKVCEECRARKKSQLFCRVNQKHDAPTWKEAIEARKISAGSTTGSALPAPAAEPTEPSQRAAAQEAGGHNGAPHEAMAAGQVASTGRQGLPRHTDGKRRIQPVPVVKDAILRVFDKVPDDPARGRGAHEVGSCGEKSDDDEVDRDEFNSSEEEEEDGAGAS
mmetsp:Transcript_6489/g.14909  ORF Transcript_6489/g.14909 Transcript_6489/m.14909 type:complete len:284 (-) Transcript_6489:164-1015(-)